MPDRGIVCVLRFPAQRKAEMKYTAGSDCRGPAVDEKCIVYVCHGAIYVRDEEGRGGLC